MSVRRFISMPFLPRNRRHLAAWLLLIALLVCSRFASAQGLTAENISSLVESYLHRNGVPGAMVAVTDGDRVVLAKGFGTDGSGNPFTADTALPVASLSKSFTALAVLQLAEAGKIDLEQPVVRYLPEFRLDDARFQTITVRQLLEHRSGMSDRVFPEKSLRPVPQTLQQAVSTLKTARLASAPGTRRAYHNPNYWVLARMVEVVTGELFALYLQQHIAHPLGMVRTTTVDALPASLQQGHIRVLNHPIRRAEPRWFLGGCCGVVTSANDLARWLVFQSGQGRGIISSTSLQAMHGGLGWNSYKDENGQQRIAHDGILFTYTAQQYLLPGVGHGIGIAVVTNTGLNAAPLDAMAIADLLADLAEGHQPTQPPPYLLLVDGFLIALMLVIAALTVWRIRKNRARPQGSKVRNLSFAGFAALVVFAACAYPATLRTLSGRDLNMEQWLLVSPLLFLFSVEIAVCVFVVACARFRRSQVA